MKRTILISIISLCLVSSVFCQKQNDEQLIKISNSYANQLVQGNCEAAYSRMSEDYKVSTTLERFESEWKANTEELGEFKNFKVKVIDNGTKTYQTVQIAYQFAKGKLYADYLFGSNAMFPLGVSYSKIDTSAKKQSASNVGLKELCEPYFKLGFGITGYSNDNLAIKLPKYMSLGAENFNSCSLTNLMKPSYILNQSKSKFNLQKGIDEPGLDFSGIESTLRWCKANNVQMRGHTLVWHTQAPEWFFREGYKTDGELVSREVMIARMDSMIKQYMEFCQKKYPGVVYCWDVVNEAVDPAQGDEESFFRCRKVNDKNPNRWYDTIGPDYPELAFISARKYAAEGVKLFYNDYGTTDRTKREYIYKLCKDLNEKGLIDGIGMQGYWDNRNPNLRTVSETINLYAELGLEIQLTEWTIEATSYDEKGLAEQAERYASVFRLLQKLDTQGGGNANITSVTFFGLMDGYPFYKNDKSTSRLFNKNYEAKPVFYSVKDTFELFYK